MEEKNNLISIITPVYNSSLTIQKTIESVISQTYENWELIIIDDGSTDNTEKIVKLNYSQDLRIIFHKRDFLPKGGSSCRNFGISVANGDYIIFLDSDDILESYCLKQRVKIMNENDKLDFAVFRFRYIDENGNKTENNFINKRDALINFLSNESYWNITCPIWKKSSLYKIDLFNPNFNRYQDIELHIKALTSVNLKYKIIENSCPDVIIVPSYNKDNFQFIDKIYESQKLLIPMVTFRLKLTNKIALSKYLVGYLNNWFYYIHKNNLTNNYHNKTLELINLYYKYKVLNYCKVQIYKLLYLTFYFFINLISKYFHFITKNIFKQL